MTDSCIVAGMVVGEQYVFDPARQAEIIAQAKARVAAQEKARDRWGKGYGKWGGGTGIVVDGDYLTLSATLATRERHRERAFHPTQRLRP